MTSPSEYALKDEICGKSHIFLRGWHCSKAQIPKPIKVKFSVCYHHVHPALSYLLASLSIRITCVIIPSHQLTAISFVHVSGEIRPPQRNSGWHISSTLNTPWCKVMAQDTDQVKLLHMYTVVIQTKTYTPNQRMNTIVMFWTLGELTASPISPTISRRRGLWLASTRSHFAMNCPCANNVDPWSGIVPAEGVALVPVLCTYGINKCDKHNRFSLFPEKRSWPLSMTDINLYVYDLLAQHMML